MSKHKETGGPSCVGYETPLTDPKALLLEERTAPSCPERLQRTDAEPEPA